MLIEKGNKVTIIEMLPEVAPNLNAIVRVDMLADFEEKGVDIKVNSTVKKIEQGRVTFEKDDEIHAIDVDKVVLALGQKPYGTELFYMLKQDGIETMIIGDAKEPAKIIDAVKEAFWVVMSQDF
jgi:pyruvate/2-oxoglutarate dehydrogenase complex dihydrolipoamide dehydrogenase (E3) component